MENENLELMETEDSDLIEYSENEGSGDRFGLGLAIGALVTTATIAGVKKVKKVIAKRKAAKETEIEDDFEDEVDEAEVDDQPVHNHPPK